MIRSAEDLLQELSSLDESQRIEAKRGAQIDRSVMETVCAFANEPGLGGGYLLLGVVRDQQDFFSNAYSVVGVDNPDKLQSDLASQCASVFNRPVRPRVAVETLNGKAVVVAYVPEAAPTDKPVFLSNLGLPRGAYRRIGPTDQEGTEDDLIALYAGHQIDTHDGTVLADADLQDLDPTAVEDYRQLRRQINPTAEELVWSDNDLLRALGCVQRVGEQLKPTVAGVLLFGTSMALRRCFPMMRIDYIRVPGRQWVENPDHRFDTLEIRAPMFTAIRRATNTVRDELLQSFTLPEGALAREDEPTLPLRVIREAIVNAVMHRSYRIHGAIQIIRYANRLEIRNPGHSIKAEEQLGEPGSETRNPRDARADGGPRPAAPHLRVVAPPRSVRRHLSVPPLPRRRRSGLAAQADAGGVVRRRGACPRFRARAGCYRQCRISHHQPHRHAQRFGPPASSARSGSAGNEGQRQSHLLCIRSCVFRRPIGCRGKYPPGTHKYTPGD